MSIDTYGKVKANIKTLLHDHDLDFSHSANDIDKHDSDRYVEIQDLTTTIGNDDSMEFKCYFKDTDTSMTVKVKPVINGSKTELEVSANSTYGYFTRQTDYYTLEKTK